MTKLNYQDRSNAVAEMTMPQRITLKAKKVQITTVAKFYKTELYSPDGTLKLTIPALIRQPMKGQRTIDLFGTVYNLEWVD